MPVSKKVGRIVLISVFSLIVLTAGLLYLLLKRDKAPPVFVRPVTIKSTNRITALARSGDEVTLRFAIEGAEDLLPLVEIAGRETPAIRKGLEYTATRALDEADPEGPLDFSIELRDTKGISVAHVEHTTDGSTVTYDATAPRLEDLSVASDNPRFPMYVNTGSKIIVSLKADEPLGAPPEISVGGIIAEKVDQINPAEYTAHIELTDEVKTGGVPLSIEMLDAVGNRGTASISGDSGVLIYDPRQPLITVVAIVSTNPKNRSIARPGDSIVLFFAVNEELGDFPVVNIAGSPPDRLVKLSAKSYEARLAVSARMALRDPKFWIYVEDRAGNAASVANTTTDGSSIAFAAPSPGIPEAETRVAVTDRSDEPQVPPKSVVLPPEPPEPVEPEEVPPAQEIGFQDTRKPDEYIGFRIHFSLSIVRTTAREEEFRYVEVPSFLDEEIGALAEQPPPPPIRKPEVKEPIEEIKKVEETVEVVIQAEKVTDEPEEPEAVVDSDARVIIDSPRNESLYGSAVEVTGRVLEADKIDSLTYEVSPLVFLGQRSAFLSGEAEVGEDGNFSFLFSTEELSGSQQVVVTAGYGDGRQETAILSIFEGESDIPTFAVTPDGESAILRWDTHPLAESYSVRYSDLSAADGAVEKELANIESPSKITGLSFGHRYSFQLAAYTGDGGFVGDSNRKEIVALDEETLAPTVTGEYKRIKVTWPEISGATGFEIERSVDLASDNVSVVGPVNNTIYYDTDVLYGRLYSYRVRPAGGALFSKVISGEPLAFPEERTRLAVSWDDITVANARVYGNYTYVAAEENGLVIFDISDPNKPVFVSAIKTNNARDVAVLDDYAYVADADRGLRVIDIDNPWQPVEVGSRKTSDARAIALRRLDNNTMHAIIADGSFGVKILDVTNPKDPERIDTIPSTEAKDLELITSNGVTYAVVADGEGGVIIIDLRTKDVTAVVPTADASGVAISEELLYVADNVEGLKIVDISWITGPKLISEYEMTSATAIAVAGEFAYVAADQNGLVIFDVSAPQFPVFYDGIEIEGVKAIALKGSRLFAGGTKGFHLLDTFTKGESYEVASVQTDGKAYEVSVDTSTEDRIFAYVADRAGGLKIFDVTVPDTLGESSLIARIETEYCREAIAVGDYVYVADGPGGLKIVDISGLRSKDEAAETPIVGSWDTDGNSRSLSYANGLIYIADGNRGIKVIDVSSPVHPVEIGSVRTEYATNIQVADGNVFLADGDGGFRIYDADPGSLELLATVDTANTRGVDVQEGIAYVVGSAGLSVIDVSKPRTPEEIGFYRTGYAEEVEVEGRLAYVAEGINGLTIIDVADPTDPYTVSRSKNKYTVGVAVSGKYAFLVDTTGLRVVEILIPSWAMRE